MRKLIQAKTSGQAEYLKKITENDIVVGIGPAGTGKTFLAMAAAVDALTKKKVKRIILARPAVEAGESLGFLPGDMQAKVDPTTPVPGRVLWIETIISKLLRGWI